MTLYAILQRPIGRIFGWAIPDHIAKTSPVVIRCGDEWFQHDLRSDGVTMLTAAKPELNNTRSKVQSA